MTEETNVVRGGFWVAVIFLVIGIFIGHGVWVRVVTDIQYQTVPLESFAKDCLSLGGTYRAYYEYPGARGIHTVCDHPARTDSIDVY